MVNSFLVKRRAVKRRKTTRIASKRYARSMSMLPPPRKVVSRTSFYRVTFPVTVQLGRRRSTSSPYTPFGDPPENFVLPLGRLLNSSGPLTYYWPFSDGTGTAGDNDIVRVQSHPGPQLLKLFDQVKINRVQVDIMSLPNVLDSTYFARLQTCLDNEGVTSTPSTLQTLDYWTGRQYYRSLIRNGEDSVKVYTRYASAKGFQRRSTYISTSALPKLYSTYVAWVPNPLEMETTEESHCFWPIFMMSQSTPRADTGTYSGVFNTGTNFPNWDGEAQLVVYFDLTFKTLSAQPEE